MKTNEIKTAKTIRSLQKLEKLSTDHLRIKTHAVLKSFECELSSWKMDKLIKQTFNSIFLGET